jgi:hypothetical protein
MPMDLDRDANDMTAQGVANKPCAPLRLFVSLWNF